jgi:putative glycosyltransferase (TIGR04348 family)
MSRTPRRPRLLIVTPAMAQANNGNWQTAARWRELLKTDYEVQLCTAWPSDVSDETAFDLMLALHARRSAASIAAWAETQAHKPLCVVLTGTDLYRDIHADAAAQRSLELAHRLIVLHEEAIADLPHVHRSKARVCLQSCSARAAYLHKASRHLRALMVGHLRQEKAPEVYFAAAQALRSRRDIWLDHIGRPLDEALGQQAVALMRTQPHYRWLGGLPHPATRERIRRAHVLVHPSTMEGGAHVVMEALRSGTAVIASRIPGNLGMLGPGYGGYFEPGDAQGLARLLQRARDEPDMLRGLQAQCQARAALFSPDEERTRLLGILRGLLV